MPLQANRATEHRPACRWTKAPGSIPLSPHAVAKLAGEMYLRAYAEMYGLAPICLALANVYGPRQNPHGAAGVIAVLGSAMITGQPVRRELGRRCGP